MKIVYIQGTVQGQISEISANVVDAGLDFPSVNCPASVQVSLDGLYRRIVSRRLRPSNPPVK